NILLMNWIIINKILLTYHLLICVICKFAYQCHIRLLKSYRYFMTYCDMIPLHLTSTSLHKINHYLAPIIDELKSLWDGMTYRTYECQEGRKIRAALILVSCNIPAARKICGHVSSLVACHICKKRRIMKIGSITLLEWMT